MKLIWETIKGAFAFAAVIALTWIFVIELHFLVEFFG